MIRVPKGISKTLAVDLDRQMHDSVLLSLEPRFRESQWAAHS